MFSPTPTYLPVRQRGQLCDVGDSIDSGFGGAVPWITQAGSRWWPDVIVANNQAIAGQAVGITLGAIPAMISAGQLALCDGAFDGSKDYNIATITSGLNDLANGRTAAQVYADLTTWKNGRAALGYKTIYLCPIRLDGGFFSTAPAQTLRTDLITLATVNAAGFDAVINMDSVPGTPGDGINYDPDHVHMTTAGQTARMLLIIPVKRSLVGP